MNDFAYEVFVSHAREDRDLVHGYLLPALNLPRERVLLPEDLPADPPAVSAWENYLEKSRVTLVILTPAWIADVWAGFGADFAAHQAIEEQRQRLIPLLFEACEPPIYLRNLVPLDCLRAEDWEPAMSRLRATLSQPTPEPSYAECPYPGMVPFSSEHPELFHGRDQEIERLLELVKKERRTLIVGPSGSGKSSLIFAGLIPAAHVLSREEVHIHIMRPGATPLQTLQRILGETPERSGLEILIVDQLEELFTQSDAHTCRSFAEELRKRTAEKPSWRTILALRADFYPELLNSPLWPFRAEERLDIAPLRGPALREAIVRPALSKKVLLEGTLVERLILESNDEPGALPLLQDVLRFLWEESQKLGLRRFVPLRLYANTNGLAALVSQRADRIVDQLDSAGVILARRMLLRLIQFGQGRPDTRRQQAMTALLESGAITERERAIVQHLAEHRLLTLSSAPRGSGEEETRVDLAHEALIAGWPRFRRWIDERRDAEQTRRRLEAGAEEWVRLGSGTGGLLDSAELPEAQRWSSASSLLDLGISTKLREWIEHSRAELERLENERRRALRRLQMLVSALAVLLIIAVVAGAIAFIQRARAAQRLTLAVEVADRIVFAINRRLESIAGASAIRQSLLEDAILVQEQLRAETGDEDEDVLRARAASRGQQGELYLSRGDLSRARREHEAALALDERLVKRYPENTLHLRNLAVTYSKLGDVAMREGNLREARSFYEQDLSMVRTLLKTAGGDPLGLRASEAGALERLGNISLESGRLIETRDYYREALNIRQTLAENGSAEARQAVALGFMKMADYARAAESSTTARAFAENAVKIEEQLVATEPKHVAYRVTLALARTQVSIIAQWQAELDDARSSAESAVEILEDLLKSDDGNAEVKRSLAAGVERLADVHRELGDVDRAKSGFERALALRETLARADTKNTEHQRLLAVSYSRLGELAFSRRHLEDARRNFTADLPITEALAAADPLNARWQRDLAVSLSSAADVEAEEKNFGPARGLFERALSIERSLFELDRDNDQARNDVATTLGKLGNMALQLRRLDEASRYFEESMRLFAFSAAASQADPVAQRNLSIAHAKLGDLRVEQGDAANAEHPILEMLRIRRELVRIAPKNAEWKRDLGAGLGLAAKLEELRSRREDAERYLREALQLAEQLAKEDAHNATYKRDLAVICERLGDLAIARRDFAAAEKWLKRDLETSKNLAKESPNDPQLAADLAIAYDKLGDLAQHREDLGNAAKYFSAAYALREKTSAPDRDRVISLQKLGDVALLGAEYGEAKTLFEKALALTSSTAVASDASALRDRIILRYRVTVTAFASKDLASARQSMELAKADVTELARRSAYMDDDVIMQIREQLEGIDQQLRATEKPR